MSEQETKGLGARWKQIGASVWGFWKPVLIIIAIILVCVGLSFFFWGEFSVRAYTERLTYAGLGAIVFAGFTIFASLSAYSTLGTPSIFTAAADARIATERVGEYLRTNAKRYAFTFRMFAVAIICLALSALIDVLSALLG